MRIPDENITLVLLHAGRHALKKELKRGFNRSRMLKLKYILPYYVAFKEGDNTTRAAVTCRVYAPLGESEHGLQDPRERPGGVLPVDKILNLHQIGGRHEFWLYNDSSQPWRSRACAENYLELLERVFDFHTNIIGEPLPEENT